MGARIISRFIHALTLLLVIWSSSPVHGSPASTRNGIWSVELLGEKHALKGGDGNEYIGNSSGVLIGHGYIGPRWFVRGTLDVVFGPYEPVRGGQFEIDYAGTGVSTWWGYSAQPIDLRDQMGGYGLAIGMRYTDVVGRSVGGNRREVSGEDSNLIDAYSLRLTNFSLVPSLFFSWLKRSRPEGDSPELLKTRIEGYFLTVGLAMPILATYTARMQNRLDPDVYQQEDPQAEIDGNKVEMRRDVTQRGKFQGYSLVIIFSTLLGV